MHYTQSRYRDIQHKQPGYRDIFIIHNLDRYRDIFIIHILDIEIYSSYTT